MDSCPPTACTGRDLIIENTGHGIDCFAALGESSASAISVLLSWCRKSVRRDEYVFGSKADVDILAAGWMSCSLLMDEISVGTGLASYVNKL